MKATLRSRVFEAIKNEYPGTLTNNQLAIRLGENQPSVRVATLALRRNGDILERGGGYGSVAIEWRLDTFKHPVGVSPVTQAAASTPANV